MDIAILIGLKHDHMVPNVLLGLMADAPAMSRTVVPVVFFSFPIITTFQMNKHLKPLGLYLSTRQFLITLRRHLEGLMHPDLADKLGIEGSTLVRLLDDPEQKGWIRRVPSRDDKRR